MKYIRIIAAAVEHPWAVTDEVYHSILSVLVRCEAGERFTAEQIRDVVGEKKERVAPYLVDERGQRADWEAFTVGNLENGMAVELKATGDKTVKGTVAVLPVYGIIAQRVSQLDISEGGTGIDALTAQFRAAVADPNVKAIVLDFDSPGGSVYGIDELAQEIFAARDQKKIIAQVNSLAASAAYYLASQASEVVATPGGEVGSIGVRTMHTDISQALAQKGIKVTPITFGKYKAEGNPYEPLSQEARDFMQQRVNDYGEAFVQAVARGRGVKPSVVREDFGQGRVFGSKQAKSLGMVDRVGTLDETLARLGVSTSAAVTPMAASTSVAASPAVSAAATPATAESTEEVQMDPKDEATAAAAATAETTRCAAISQLVDAHKIPASKAMAWVTGKTTVEAVQAEILASLNAKAVPIRTTSAEQIDAAFVTDQYDKLPKGVVLGRTVRAVAGAARARHSSMNNLGTPAAFARHALNDPILAARFEAAQDPQTASGFASGGFLIEEQLVMDVIELLRPMAVVRSLNPALAPLVNGTLNMPKLTGGATANYVGETKPITPSKVKGGRVKATAKKLATLVPISNDLLRFASIAADMLVRDDMVRAMAQAEDLAFIRGTGSVYSPKGLRYWAPSANVTNSSITHSQIDSDTALQVLNAVRADLSTLRLGLRKSNRPFIKPGWIISPRTENFLMFNVTDSFGNLAFGREMQDKGTILNWPYRVTTQIPENLSVVGSGIDSEIYLAEFADVVIADAPTIAIEISNEASYDDGTGTLVSSFSNDETLIRMISEHDLVVRHDETVFVLAGVEYYV